MATTTPTHPTSALHEVWRATAHRLLADPPPGHTPPPTPEVTALATAAPGSPAATSPSPGSPAATSPTPGSPATSISPENHRSVQVWSNAPATACVRLITAAGGDYQPVRSWSSRSLGIWGEEVVARLVTHHPTWHIVDRNWRCHRGEIDIIARHASTIVAIEVKTRRNQHFGGGVEAITATKQLHMRRTLAAWAHEYRRSDIMQGVQALRCDLADVTINARFIPADGHSGGIAEELSAFLHWYKDVAS